MESINETEYQLQIGYIVIADREEKGFVGGYLCTDERGVPLGFWHTSDSPVKADHLQKLLYGKTLRPELLGRHITGSLVKGPQGTNKIRPSVLFTQEAAIVMGFDDPDVPVILINDHHENPPPDAADGLYRETIKTDSGEITIWCKPETSKKIKEIIPNLKNVDILEPFDRIKILLDELGGIGIEKNEG
jgi:hypothetical protein